MADKTFRAGPYVPTSARAGDGTGAIFRGKNLMLRGKSSSRDRWYLEAYAGSRDLGETIPDLALTGTISSLDGRTLLGTGTLFLTELHPGQLIMAGAALYVIEEVIDNLTAKCVGQSFSVIGSTAVRCPVLFEVDRRRGSQVWGNAVQLDKGTIIDVGAGTLRLNGAVLPGSSLAAARSPKIAIFDPVTGNYTVYTPGMTATGNPTLLGVAGGTKGMVAATYGIRLVPARQATAGWNQPTTNVTVTITATQRIRITFPAMDTANGQDSWRVYGTQFTQNGSINGPWYYVQTITLADLGGIATAGTTFNVEWLDAEIARNDLLEFDNFPANLEAEFIATLGGNPIYISCFGRMGGSPGPNLVPVKPRNIEAALININLRLDPPHTIIGWTVNLGRLYLLTINSLQIGTLQQIANFPITTRPFWRRGFHNPYSLCFVNDRLYGWTEVGPTRSALDGDEGSEQFLFGGDVMEITSRWTDGKVYVIHDPVNECVLFIHSADSQAEASTFWRSVILPYSLQLEQWMTPIILESATGDMIVSGAATVANRAYFIAGGRQSGGGRAWRTYEFDSYDLLTAAPNVPWYAAWEFQDDGEEQHAKRVKSIRITAKGNLTAGIYGTEPGEMLNVAMLEEGAGGKSGNIPYGNFTTLRRGDLQELNLPELDLYTVRVGGSSNAGAGRDRIDEVYLEVESRTMRR